MPICHRLGMSVVLGYLFAGIAIGPGGLALVGERQAASEVMHFAEIGVVLLLFIIGLELQPRRLWVMRRVVFGLGSMQVAATTVVLALAGLLLGLSWPAAVLIGFALALSSTAFVLQLLAERKSLNYAHGRAAFGTLLLQDVAVIPAIALLDLMGPSDGSETLGTSLVKVGVVVAGLIGARFALRPLLKFVAATGIHELFTAAALALVVGAALTMESIGLSMGLGAFIAGMMVADSEYRHQLESDVAPFKGLLLGLFFMAVGMSADLTLLIEQPLQIAALALGLMLLKTVVLVPLARLIGLDRAESLRFAAVMSQGGEFGFVLLGAGVLAALIEPGAGDVAVLVITASMMLTPLYTAAIERLLRKAASPPPAYDQVSELEDPQVVIAGFGRVGQIIGRILSMRHIPFTALESSSSQVEFVREYGNRVYYGDPSNRELLRSAHIEAARAIIIAVDDAEAALKIAAEVRTHYPRTKIFARARNRQHELKLRELGVDFVIRETLGSSLIMGAELLESLGSTRAEAEAAVEVFRRHDARAMERQQAVHHDDEAFRAAAMDAAKELETLFSEDAGAAGIPDVPGDPRL